MEGECKPHILNRHSGREEKVFDAIFKELVAEVLPDLMKYVKHRRDMKL